MSSDLGRRARLARLFHPTSRRQINVAVDHGNFGLLEGVEDMARVLAAVLPGAPESIQLPPGSARTYAASDERRPALVLRLDRTNCYAKPARGATFDALIADVEAAVRLDAAAVVVNLLAIPGEEAVAAQCVENISRVRAECERYGMPLMVEPLLFTPEGGTDRHPGRVAAKVREACESGADLVKCDYTDAEFERVVEAAGGVPLSVRGGDVREPLALFRAVKAVLDAGARGITFGRNIVRAKDPARTIRAYARIVHLGGTPEQALADL
jgi:DhnA family fructose-bisphosphate aldolase class Ia